MTSTRPRQGSIWCAEDYLLLVDALRRNLPDEEVADHLGRTISGVRSRAKFLLRNAYAGADALRALRRMLSEPDFHWEALVTDAHEAAGIPYWDKVADQRIITGWTSEPPPTMVNLADQLGVDEQAIARRCIQLKLSDSRLAVVERFGAVPGGSLETQARLARDNASVIVAVLAVAAREGQILHLSIHPTEESAISLLRSLDPDALTAAPTHWTVVPRIVGEGSVRIGLSGEWSDVSRLPQHPNT